jgi:methylated-DNA-[protein]-cysteine S-methyltransferase
MTQLSQYFSGMRQSFDLPIEPEGTNFQKLAWQALTKIPYGSRITYKEQAISLGDGKKARAVGLANGRNPLPILIPCHRVISSDGSLGGYSQGLDKKKFLLKLEGADFGKNWDRSRDLFACGMA